LNKVDLITVEAGAVLLTDRPDFGWNGVIGATRYLIQISRTNTFKKLLVNKSVTSSELGLTKDLPVNTVLYWRVRAETAYVKGPWSETWNFTTDNPPSVPVLKSPKNNGLTTDYTPRLDWKNSSVPKLNVFDHYQLQLSTTVDFVEPLVDVVVEGRLNSEYTLPVELDPNTTYYWRVRAFDTMGAYSGWSKIWRLRTAIAPPELELPADLENVTDLRPEFDWVDVEGAMSYTIQISRNMSFSNRLVSKKVSGSSYTPTSNLLKGRTLYWRVRGNGPNGPSQWSIVREFTTP